MAYTVTVAESSQTLCYTCSLLFARDIPWSLLCSLRQHATITQEAWYDRYTEAPLMVSLSNHERLARKMREGLVR